MRRLVLTLSLGAPLLLAACATVAPTGPTTSTSGTTQPAATAPAQPKVTHTPLPSNTGARPATPRPAGPWQDWPITPGNWLYLAGGNGPMAVYGAARQDALLVLRCDRATGQLALSVPGYLPPGNQAAMAVTTDNLAARYAVRNSGSTPPYVEIALGARDPLFDAMIHTRGRAVIDVDGAAQPLVLPIWGEFARTVEDCRG